MKDVLITGGSGFFGQACIRTLLEEDGDGRICVFSRDEFKQAVLRERFTSPRMRWFVGDVRDRDRLRRAMRGVDLVIHAAALKRIEVGAYDPIEMVRTNVDGAVNICEAAMDSGVKKVIGLSTDKAFQPVSAYGHSKALAESLFLASNNERHGPLFACCRYGNVAGSTGSIIPRWRELLKKQDWVPVTDPECTRFWMTAAEAVDLVLDTADHMKGGELAIPKLPAFTVGDLAEVMGAKMKIIGLPAHEKKHESMSEGNCSSDATRMTLDELRYGVQCV